MLTAESEYVNTTHIAENIFVEGRIDLKIYKIRK